MSETIFLGLGSDTGNRENHLRNAIDRIRMEAGAVVSMSHIYETEPWGFQSTTKFLNMVIKVETMLDPENLLGVISAIEADMGRIRTKKRYTSRNIDIDILLWGEEVIRKVNLVIPHPLIQERRFVLVPLCNLVPDSVHPVLEKTFSTLLQECPDKGEVKLWANKLPL